ncbi:MAG: M20/M25/M40 family metallo-hydrolase [Campylobacterota bacterium]|nr:M20/M25/M40 family metallo-hydrolase [Campylobacterota bacterium]
MSAVLHHFKTITTVHHCSKEADKLFEYLTLFGRERGYEVQTDEAQNILISKGTPKLCLQAHYDMVCMGKAPEIKTYEEDGWLKAEESSLGADNGMAIAMMMVLMDEGVELEFLITADEEIGLIGANALSFALRSKYMLNLDSEDEAEVYIGCAGGVDIVATKPYALIGDDRPAYRVTVSGLSGGHSGVDIDKGIPNALKLLAGYLKDQKIGLVSIKGGERRNSIPVMASAIVKSDSILQSNEIVEVEAIECSDPILYGGSEIIDLMKGFSHGVQEVSEALKIPERSINLAIVSTQGSLCKIETSARAMSTEGLTQISGETLYFFESYGFDVEMVDKYPSWKPEVNSFTEDVSVCMKEVFGESKMMAIHAGLECGVIAQKYPALKLASIGPTIRYPHSTREKVKIDSVDKTFDVLKRVIARVN